MLGTQDEAEVAFLLCRLYLDGDNVKAAAPGWEFLGRGIHRWAYLSPSNVVYKVPFERNYSRANENEYKLILQHSTDERLLSANIRFPKCSRFEVEEQPVLAAEFCGDERPSGEHTDEFDEMPVEKRTLLWEVCRLSDLHNGNFRVDDDGVYVVIDAGH